MDQRHLIEHEPVARLHHSYQEIMQLSPRLVAMMIMIAAFSLGGCGRKGALEDPPNAASGEQATQATPASPVAAMPVPKSKTEKPKIKLPQQTPFILDPLL